MIVGSPVTDLASMTSCAPPGDLTTSSTHSPIQKKSTLIRKASLVAAVHRVTDFTS